MMARAQRVNGTRRASGVLAPVVNDQRTTEIQSRTVVGLELESIWTGRGCQQKSIPDGGEFLRWQGGVPLERGGVGAGVQRGQNRIRERDGIDGRSLGSAVVVGIQSDRLPMEEPVHIGCHGAQHHET